MGYKLMITEQAEELLDSLVCHILFELKNEPAALLLLDGVQKIYHCLEQSLLPFPVSGDGYLSDKGYREAIVPEMNYMVVFDMVDQSIIILGIFHRQEIFE
ncbi:MAG: type II toxin-antitoxin system RelE/ParE family toxin [Lachnospiraceae bacterium]|jgi:hypothetical protein|nr:type II toxin-antitoxin system RelE/ParE family toxin [Lachnospiraceae bacterium]MCI9283716.1 type II toxin-antitoxin system RelE/ParE family toxin [Lachnospiraceae bacterium]